MSRYNLGLTDTEISIDFISNVLSQGSQLGVPSDFLSSDTINE